MKKLISTLVFSFISYIAFTQISPNLINSSTLIIEGKIIEQRCIENEKDDNIYTLNTIKILKKFKGFTNSKIITLVTIGGKIENIEQTWSHGFSLSNEQEGIFFLNKDILISSEFFVIANNREGFIRFVDYDDLCPKAYSEHFQGANIQNSVYEVLEDLTHNKLEIVELNKYENTLNNIKLNRGVSCVEYHLANPRITKVDNSTSNVDNTGYFFNFDIEIRSTEENFDYEKTIFSMSYPKNLFGEYIVSQNVIKIENGLDFNNYNFSLSDETSTKWQIVVKRNTNETPIKINNFYQKLFTATLFLKTNDLSQLLELKVDEINDLKTFQTQNGITSEFKCSIFNKNISNPITNFVAPFITNINTEPLTAGTRTLLTINGTNLWPINVSTKSEVWFTNAYSGNPGEWIKPLSGDYKSVSDTKIEVYVPTNAVDANSGTGSTDRYYAGTGSIKVVVKNTPNVSSNTKSLKIKYAVKNDTYLGKGQPIFLCKNNDKNGYTIGYTTAFKNKTDAKGNKFSDAFARAIKLWQCKTGLNFIIDANNTNPDIIIGLIDFPLNSISTLASTRITSFFPDVCDLEINNGSLNHPETFKVDFAKKVITIDYNSNYLGVANSLEAGISENIEIAGLHELGHAHCILHVNEANELMNWQLSVSNKITTEAENASNYIINHSVKQKCSQGSFEKYDCKTTTTELDINLNIYAIISEDIINLYNPNKHNITKISILDIQGRVILENNYDNIVDEIIPFKSPITQNGIYFLIVKSNNGTKSIKFSKINN